jgi:hypothetical protein
MKVIKSLLLIVLLCVAVVGCEEDLDIDQIYTVQYGPEDIPDVFKMDDKTNVTAAGQWPARREEIRAIMQDNSYGQWRSGETVTYKILTAVYGGNTYNILPVKISDTILRVNVLHDGKTVEFDAYVELPKGTPPSDGWPVIIAFGGLDGADTWMGSKGNPRQYALDKGYANICVPTYGYTIDGVTTATVASDDNSHKGVFYTLYPYGTTAESQTGVLMAWAWGASKVLDALETGAAEDFGINVNNTIVTAGTSRYGRIAGHGKAAAVAGAFEERFKITVPVSSGTGGAAMYRYYSEGQTYDLRDYFKYNGGGGWTVDDDNPQSFSSIKSVSGGGWFNAKFKTFSQPEDLPFDQHFLLALCADTDRYLFMVNGFEWDKWTNPPGLFYAFEKTKPVFDLLGVPQNIAVSLHCYRRGMEQEDMVKLIKYANNIFYGIQDLAFDYEETGKPKPATWEEFMSDLQTTLFSASVSPENNKTYESGKPRVATE